MRKTARTTALLAAALLAPLVATAQPELKVPGETVLEGVVKHDPLRVSVNWSLATFPAQQIRPSLRAVLAQPELEDTEVSVITTKRGIVAIEARTRGDVSMLSGPGLGAETLGTIKAHTAVRILSSKRVDGRLWVKVLKHGSIWQGTVSADQLELATPGAASSWIGKQLAPLFAAGTTKREARFFHPDGHVFQATVTDLQPTEFRATASELAGQALIRIGGGARKLESDGQESDGKDVLSLAIRFTGANHALDTQVRPGDQDLHLSAWAERFSHFAVRSWLGDHHDFMNNIYFPAIPYRIDGKPVWLRVIPKRAKLPHLTFRGSPATPGRIQRLEADIKADTARFILQVQRGEWWRVYRPWTSLVEIRFTQQRPDIDQNKLKYHPDLQGAGLKPVGFVTGIRSAVYRASQDARDRLGAKQRLERGGKN